jgi:hypothetical protein
VTSGLTDLPPLSRMYVMRKCLVPRLVLVAAVVLVLCVMPASRASATALTGHVLDGEAGMLLAGAIVQGSKPGEVTVSDSSASRTNLILRIMTSARSVPLTDITDRDFAESPLLHKVAAAAASLTLEMDAQRQRELLKHRVSWMGPMLYINEVDAWRLEPSRVAAGHSRVRLGASARSSSRRRHPLAAPSATAVLHSGLWSLTSALPVPPLGVLGVLGGSQLSGASAVSC